MSIPHNGTALLLSAKLAGGVRVLASAMRRRGWRVVLLSEVADDPNAEACDDHVMVDWDGGDEAVADALDHAGIRADAVVNMVESLVVRRASLIAQLGLADPTAGVAALTDKAEVRRAADAAGVFPIRWTAGTVREIAANPPTEYPVVVKPAVVSGASRDVHLASSMVELASVATGLGQRGEEPFILEEFLDGEEFSVDGYVVDGRFHPAFVADKPDHDSVRLHDRGLRVSPPVRVPADAVNRFVHGLQALVDQLGLDRTWLHAEGRVGPDGRIGLIEVNPRPGGGLYPAAIRHRSGVDPIEVSLDLALGNRLPPSAAGHDDLLAIVPVEAGSVGVVRCRTTADELRAIDGVMDAYVIDGYQVSSVDKENFFAAVMVTGRDEQELRQRAANALAALDFTVTGADG
ncbi:ATP-grasp domain-containing protein [Kutzneria chonburiensis]|uniref:Acetyl-CoA carboxylase biotin carboxylase subunit family protein n=1 Tax=Kutzneria chonburiensis TaxID=1483604 RepID=A0ABV6MQJ1_9PSEU|nr:ATP-grasp domain-containing protein [Kutzneria chonburiensis]